MNYDLKNILLDLDFTPAEAEVYLFLLKHGSAAVKEIINEAGVPMRTVYEVLENFKKTGLVSSLDAKPRKYIIESPRQLVNFVENKLKAQRETFEKKLVQLLAEASGPDMTSIEASGPDMTTDRFSPDGHFTPSSEIAGTVHIWRRAGEKNYHFHLPFMSLRDIMIFDIELYRTG